jgi:hypothetical protein
MRTSATITRTCKPQRTSPRAIAAANNAAAKRIAARNRYNRTMHALQYATGGLIALAIIRSGIADHAASIVLTALAGAF